VTESVETIRSYQRIFRPERRIYQIEGRPLPIPGGVPLRWLAYATGSLLAVLILSAGSTAVVLAAASVAATAGYRVGGGEGAVAAAVAAAASTWLGGWALGLLDWPLRLLVLPAAVATLGTQATPDGRRADRFALSWLALRLAPSRRSLGRPMPRSGLGKAVGGELWVEPDERAFQLRHSRILGPAVVFFSTPVAIRQRRRRLVMEGQGRRARGTATVTQRQVLGDGETLEVRP
jgi:hypothetical protein